MCKITKLAANTVQYKLRLLCHTTRQNMAVFFWYLVKCDFSCVSYILYSSEHWIRYMVVRFWYLVEVICLMYATILLYTVQVTFYKVPELSAMYNWSSRSLL